MKTSKSKRTRERRDLTTVIWLTKCMFRDYEESKLEKYFNINMIQQQRSTDFKFISLGLTSLSERREGL